MAGEKLLKGLEKFQIKSDSENKIFEKLDKYIQEIIQRTILQIRAITMKFQSTTF